MNKNYKIKIESKYIEKYQNTHYRAVVFDGNNQKVIAGNEWLLTEEQAMEQGQELLEIVYRRDKLMQYGINFTRKTFFDFNGFLKYMKSASLILVLPLFVCIVGSIIIDNFFHDGLFIGSLISVIVLIIASIIIIIKLPKITSNMASFVLYEGDLYRIVIINENSSEAQLISKYVSSPLGLAHLAAGEYDRQVGQQLLERNSYLHTQLDKNNCWRILNVKNITKIGKYYKIKCKIEKGKNKKIYNRVIYLQEGFNDYDQLIKCFEYMKDCSEN